MIKLSIVLIKALIFCNLFLLLSFSLSAQQFYITSGLGFGSASGGFDSPEFAVSYELGAGYEPKIGILSVSASLKVENFQFLEESDLMVFSIPIGAEIYPKWKVKPFAGLALVPSYPTQKLVDREFFLSGAVMGGVKYKFKQLTAFASFEYLADLTGYSYSTNANQQKEKYYLNRYYVSIGVNAGF